MPTSCAASVLVWPAAFFSKTSTRRGTSPGATQDIIRIHEFMLRFLPPRVVRTFTQAIELNALTEELDEKLMTALVDELGMTTAITPQLYAEGYRLCVNYEDRRYQIDLIMEVGRGVDRLVHIPLIGWTLRLARGGSPWGMERDAGLS